jgi:hypothetical protein
MPHLEILNRELGESCESERKRGEERDSIHPFFPEIPAFLIPKRDSRDSPDSWFQLLNQNGDRRGGHGIPERDRHPPRLIR